MEVSTQAREWLTLACASGVGPRTLHHLLNRFGSPSQLLTASASQLREHGLKTAAIKALHNPSPGRIEAGLAWLAGADRGLVTVGTPAYPAPLAECYDPPPILFHEGRALLLQTPCLAIVGSRRATPAAVSIARRFAGELAQCGVTVVSGLASGVDTAAHTGALEAGGNTIAVTGNGLDRVYPHANRRLAARIAEQGLLVTEFAPGTPPLARNFPRRNRVISGLSLGVLVVEAARRSGSLITARLANEQGREVFAVPGSILNPQSGGCHALIREGAKLVETVEDILEELESVTVAQRPAGEAGAEPPAVTDATTRKLLDCLRGGAANIDALIEVSGLDFGEVSTRLLALELGGQVSLDASGRFNLLQRIET